MTQLKPPPENPGRFKWDVEAFSWVLWKGDCEFDRRTFVDLLPPAEPNRLVVSEAGDRDHIMGKMQFEARHSS